LANSEKSRLTHPQYKPKEEEIKLNNKELDELNSDPENFLEDAGENLVDEISVN
jgi:hypothetical protein